MTPRKTKAPAANVAEGDVILRVEKLAVSYGAIKALHDVSLEVRRGEIVTLLGANGAGKTTTLRAISGLVPVQTGSIEWGAEKIPLQQFYGQAHRTVQMGIAHSPEGRRIFGNLSVKENLDMGAYIRSERTAEERRALQQDFDEVYSLFPRLKERLQQQAGTLSGGEQQMLAIARALMQRPRLLMLDEPSLGIAPVLVEAIFKALVKINQAGVTLLLVEQNAAAALSIASRAYVLETGHTTMSGPASKLAKDPKIRAAYLGH